MKTAVILHGMLPKKEYDDLSVDSPSNSHFLPWIQKQLLVQNILAETPEMPTPYNPNYDEWKKEFERYDINEDTILVGHSFGAGFLVKYLSENDIKVNKVALVAPFINSAENFQATEVFKDLKIDGSLSERTGGIAIFISKDDDDYIYDDYLKLEESIEGLEIFESLDRGHFTLNDMGTREFPELLEFLLK